MATSPNTSQNVAGLDPRAFPGLFIWNDAQAVSGTSGQALQSNVWRNLAPDTTYASSCSTTATYQPNILNGRPVMQFTTAQTYVFHNTVVNPIDITMFTVSRLSGVTNRRIFQGSNANILYGYWNGFKNCLYFDNGAGGGSPSILNAAPAIAANTNWDIYSLDRNENGGAYTWYNYGSNISVASASSAPFRSLCINTGVAPAETSECQVGEILVYSNALQQEQVRAIEGYLAWKWGLQSNLPRYHPYVSTPIAAVRLAGPPQMSNGPIIWVDANYTNYQTLSGTNITTLRNLGSSGINFISNVSPPAQINTASFNNLSTFSFATNATMTYTTSIPGGVRSVFFVNRNTAQMATNSFLGILNTSNVTNGQQCYFSWNGTTYNLSIGGSGIAFNVAFNTTNSILNNINFFALVDAQSTAFNVGTENGTVRTLTNNTVGGYGTGSGTYIMNTPSYANQQQIGEYIQFSYALVPAERRMIEGYIAWRWSLTGSLPATHPFKNIRPVVPVFSPLVIFGTNSTGVGRGPLQCVLWMDASQDSNANGASITSVADRSGSGYSIVPVAGNTITLTNPGLNGRPIYNFGLNRMTVTSFVWRTKFTCFFVTKADTGKWLYSQMFSGTYLNYIYGGNQQLALIDVNASFLDSVNASGVSVTGTGWNIFVFGYNNATTATPYRVNGTARTTTTITAKGDLTTNTNLYINGNETTTFDTSQVAEILHYNDNLSVAVVQKLEGYLAWKWGLVSNLPETHPYRTAPP